MLGRNRQRARAPVCEHFRHASAAVETPGRREGPPVYRESLDDRKELELPTHLIPVGQELILAVSQ